MNSGVVRLVTFWAVFGVTVTSVGGGVPWSVSATLHEFEPLLSGTLRGGSLLPLRTRSLCVIVSGHIMRTTEQTEIGDHATPDFNMILWRSFTLRTRSGERPSGRVPVSIPRGDPRRHDTPRVPSPRGG